MYPIVLRLTGKRCLVVGAGPVARRKVQGLVAAGATITVVAPDAGADLAQLPGVTVEPRAYRTDDLAGCWLAFAATDDAAVQQQVFDDGERAGVWVNAADDPARCAFYLPAVYRRPPVIVAVSTEGASPALAGWLRDRVAGGIPRRIDELATRLAEERQELRAAGLPTDGQDWSARIEALLEELGVSDGESPKI